jgi:uncharacterized protein YcaQ
VTGRRKISSLQARQFLRGAHRMDSPLPDVGSALSYLGYVQIDPLNVCGRMHDHILRNRVAGYREGELMRHLHGEEGGKALPAEKRTAFEHHMPSSDNLVAFPLEAWPHLHEAMRDRTKRSSGWLGRLTPREKDFAKRILDTVAESGPVGPEAFADDRRGRQVWGAATLAKATLQKLFFHGRLLISGRQANRRLYDLPARVLPAQVLAGSGRSVDEIERWLAITRLRQHRLVTLRRSDLALVEDVVEALDVEGCPTLYCLRQDIHWLESVRETAAASPETLLLAPLDPLIYDRRVTRHLWGFDYAWEAYTPASKRKRGYYALPVLAGSDLVGHVDLKADREHRRLAIVSRSVRRGAATASAIGRLTRFLGLKER